MALHLLNCCTGIIEERLIVKSITVIFFSIFYILSNSTFADYNNDIQADQQKRKNLKRRKVKANGAHQTATFITQLAPWSLQTSLGIPLHLLFYGIEDIINGDVLRDGRFNLYTMSQEEVFQIGVGRCKPFLGKTNCPDNYSLGSYHVSSQEQATKSEQARNNDKTLHHELGHVQASSVMGPLYVPLILVSYYISESHDSSMFEAWADLAKDNRNLPLIRSYQLRLGLFGQNNNDSLHSNVQFQIQDTRVRENVGALEEKIWEFLHISMSAPTNCPSCINIPRVSLYRDRTRFQGRLNRHQSIYNPNLNEPVVQVHASGGNTIGEYQNDGMGGHQVTSLSWSGRVGIMYVPTRAFKAYIASGATASITTNWNKTISARTDLNVGYNAEMGMIVGDAVEIKALYEQMHGFLNGTSTKRKSLTVGTTPSGEERYRLHLSGGIQSNTVTDENGRVLFDSSTVSGSIGGNF